MNSDDIRVICILRLERAESTLEDAKILFQRRSLIGAMNRIYYAMFYAVGALAWTFEFSTSKHTGMRAWFNKMVIQPGLIEDHYGRIYNKSFEMRMKGDYYDQQILDVDTVQEFLEHATPFLAALRRLTLERLDHLDKKEP